MVLKNFQNASTNISFDAPNKLGMAKPAWCSDLRDLRKEAEVKSGFLALRAHASYARVSGPKPTPRTLTEGFVHTQQAG